MSIDSDLSAAASALATALVQDHADMILETRIATALGTCVTVWRENDPKDSKSGSETGIGRRIGRRDLALLIAADLLGTDEAAAERFLRVFAEAGQ